ncbi:MAG: hypothetical protein WDN30_09880 [Pararobbsia sp.]
MLRDGSEDVFLQLAICIIAKLDARRFQCSARQTDRGAQFDMRLHAARKARNVVNQNHQPGVTVLAQERQHFLHPRTVDEAPGRVVREGL